TGKDVYVSNGTYAEPTLELASNVSIYGGFDRASDWTRTDSLARILGGVIAMNGNGVSNVTLDHLHIRASSATEPGLSSYGVRLVNATNVVVRKSIVEAGSGANGTPGMAG